MAVGAPLALGGAARPDARQLAAAVSGNMILSISDDVASLKLRATDGDLFAFGLTWLAARNRTQTSAAKPSSRSRRIAATRKWERAAANEEGRGVFTRNLAHSPEAPLAASSRF